MLPARPSDGFSIAAGVCGGSIILAGIGSCGGRALPQTSTSFQALTSPSPPDAGPHDDGPSDAGGVASQVLGQALGPEAACPSGTVLVDTTYCPDAHARCLRDEYDKANHITICHQFAPGQQCASNPRRQRFCIDRYEYPNEAGAHPPVMVSWYDATAACDAMGRRLCWQSEWESACEGPEKLPFPYGLSRNPGMCNIDNPYVRPDLDRVYSTRIEVQNAELLKLDQSTASGGMKGCVSGFGVFDLTGNFDEWVNSEHPRGKSKWAGLKGGAWGHVRNACRPLTTSHPPEFTYYFISFRCCADAAPDGTSANDPTMWTPPRPPKHLPPSHQSNQGWTTRERGPNRPKTKD
jgi:hypothetical protein